MTLPSWMMTLKTGFHVTLKHNSGVGDLTQWTACLQKLFKWQKTQKSVL